MGKRNGPYLADFAVSTKVCVADRATLERFKNEWKSHHPLAPEQLEFAGKVAIVQAIGYYHGADEVYTLEGLPGLWHEQCLCCAPEGREG